MKLFKPLLPKTGKEIPFLILISFLSTFALSRLTTYLFPNLFLSINNTHVHHFAYGIILLALTNLILLTQPRSRPTRLKMSLVYGFSLGLAFDEFLMWIQLEDNYWDRGIPDAIIIITLILLNIVYFENFWKKWGHRFKKLLLILFQ
jgi:glucan phosphoethanolaminetransferase (alkaline phosphatase superfamily)